MLLKVCHFTYRLKFHRRGMCNGHGFNLLWKVLKFLNDEKHISLWLWILTEGKYTVEFSISNVDFLLHQTLTQHITFQIDLENNYMKNYIIFEEQLTLTNDFRASCNSLTHYSTFPSLSIHSSKHKIWCFAKWTSIKKKLNEN